VARLANEAKTFQEVARRFLNVRSRWFVLRIRVPLGPSPEKVLECIQRLGEEVLPRARKG